MLKSEREKVIYLLLAYVINKSNSYKICHVSNLSLCREHLVQPLSSKQAHRGQVAQNCQTGHWMSPRPETPQTLSKSFWCLTTLTEKKKNCFFNGISCVSLCAYCLFPIWKWGWQTCSSSDLLLSLQFLPILRTLPSLHSLWKIVESGLGWYQQAPLALVAAVNFLLICLE